MPEFEFPFLRSDVPVPESWIQQLREPYEHKQFSNNGPLNQRLTALLEERFSATQRAIPVANATVGLQSALMSLNVFGKRVAVPDFSYPATFHAITAAGGIPHLVDIDEDTWQISHELIPWGDTNYGPLAAIVPVSSFGARIDHSRLIQTGKDQGVPIVMDSAAAFPARLSSQSNDLMNDVIQVFSFHATKPFAIGEGGVVICPDEHHDRMMSTITFGLGKDGAILDGTNAKMDEFAAARAIAALKMFDANAASRRHFVREVYQSVDLTGFGNLPHIETPTWSFFPLLAPSEQVAQLLEAAARREGIETKRYYTPLPSSSYVGVRQFLNTNCPKSQSFSARMICFPVYARSRSKERQSLGQRFLQIIEEVRCE